MASQPPSWKRGLIDVHLYQYLHFASTQGVVCIYCYPNKEESGFAGALQASDEEVCQPSTSGRPHAPEARGWGSRGLANGNHASPAHGRGYVQGAHMRCRVHCVKSVAIAWEIRASICSCQQGPCHSGQCTLSEKHQMHMFAAGLMGPSL